MQHKMQRQSDTATTLDTIIVLMRLHCGPEPKDRGKLTELEKQLYDNAVMNLDDLYGKMVGRYNIALNEEAEEALKTLSGISPDAVRRALDSLGYARKEEK